MEGYIPRYHQRRLGQINVVKLRLRRCHGGMASRVYEKTPPNSGGVVGFIWQGHGGCHSLNGGGGMAVMAEDSFFFFEIFTTQIGSCWADPTQP